MLVWMSPVKGKASINSHVCFLPNVNDSLEDFIQEHLGSGLRSPMETLLTMQTTLKID